MIRKLLLTISILLGALIPATYASAFNPLDPVCQQSPDNAVCRQSSAQGTSNSNPAVNIIKKAVDIIALVAGVGAVILIIISGIQIITAGGATSGRGGDPNRIKSARATLIAALIGLIIIALAWSIITFIISRVIKT